MIEVIVAAIALSAAPADASPDFPESKPLPPEWTCEILMPEGVSRDAFTVSTWPDGIVPYEFHANVDAGNQARARNAMDEIEAVCAVEFIPRTTEINRLVITDADVNNSFVGPVGGPQTVNIVSWNVRFIIVHELMHALGDWHEQQRPDRDDFVQINFNNIIPDQVGNFSIRSSIIPVGDYDFDSVMHYGQFAFSANGMRTITVLPPNEAWQAQIGQNTHLSEGDIDALVARYGSANTTDLSGDGTVDSTDLAILLAAWGGGEVDFNDDGVCDSADLAIMLAAWG